ncbi:MAG: hypothetical protein HY392_02315 [Candidatus Diapherotrites archaeon]|nr:hypothetical protein [Candidatus Diapherotrites archaeon]
MKKALLVMAGLLLVSTMAFAVTIDKTAARWNYVTGNAEANMNKIQSQTSPEYAAQIDFEEMKNLVANLKGLKNQLSTTEKRADQVEVIKEFNDNLSKLRAMFNEIEKDLPNLRGKLRV